MIDQTNGTLRLYYPIDEAPYISFHVIPQHDKLMEFLILQLYGPNTVLDKEQMPEMRDLVKDLLKTGHFSLEDGWLAITYGETAMINFFLDKYKEMRVDRDYEDSERCKALRRAEIAERELEIIREAFAIVTAKNMVNT